MARPSGSIATTFESSTDHVTVITNGWPALSFTVASICRVSSANRFAESGRRVSVFGVPVGAVPTVGGGGVNGESQAARMTRRTIGDGRTGTGIYPAGLGGANWRGARGGH